MKCENKKKDTKTAEKNAEKLTTEALEKVNGGGVFDDLPRTSDNEIDEGATDRA